MATRFYQFGIATPREVDQEKIPPLNLVLVIDRSGSMSGERIAYVKKAILAFVERLRAEDRVAIVGFSDKASVLLEATCNTQQPKIINVVENLTVQSSTNLHAGLMLGYQQAVASFDAERTNRVILLTDGIANRGITDSAQIAKDSKAFNDRDISLSTIGLGHNLNHELLRELADAGRGLIHFVGNDAEIEKTFVAEVDSLLAPAATNVKLRIDLGTSLGSAQVFGCEPERKNSKLVFKLDDLNCGATQVVLIRVPDSCPTDAISASLVYRDAISKDKRRQSASLDPVVFEHVDFEVAKNYTIAVLASGLKEAAQANLETGNAPALTRLSSSIRQAKKFEAVLQDKDVQRVLDIVKTHRQNLRRAID